jgi:hypothetical protein
MGGLAGRGGISPNLKRSRKAERMLSLYDFVGAFQGESGKKINSSTT